MKNTQAAFFSGNHAFLADLYEQFLTHPESIDPSWHAFFEPLGGHIHGKERTIAQPSWAPAQKENAPFLKSQPLTHDQPSEKPLASQPLQRHASSLAPAHHDEIRALQEFLRKKSYQFAHTNPLLPKPSLPHPLVHFYSTHKREDPVFNAVKALEISYLGPLALEVGSLTPEREYEFLTAQFESPQTKLHDDQKKDLWRLLLKATTFEKTVGKMFPGHKRFSLEGAEALLPGLWSMCHHAKQDSVPHVVFGMAHRGRLNVLTNLLGKPLFDLYKKNTHPPDGQNDVPYHLGWESTWPDASLLLTLLPNPSHLEATCPVVMGYVRALQEQQNAEMPPTLGVLIHGESAFAGQGVVMESFMLQGLSPYQGKGIIHVVLNNQLGFTATPSESFPRLATDVAHITGAPILHVNGQEPEAVLRAFNAAYLFRKTFHKDCVINLLCFRRHGHNELDEPRFTNPLLYQAIDATEPVSTSYGQHLADQGVISKQVWQETSVACEQNIRHALEKEEIQQKTLPATHRSTCPLFDEHIFQKIGHALTKQPSHFSLHPKIRRFLDKRQRVFEQGDPIDWSLAEALALGSLLESELNVRLTGQDSIRGTFTQRHGAFVDQNNEKRHIPLNHIAHNQGVLTLVNSPLSEAAAMGFEIGYSWCQPKSFVLWEAQFGDFANGAQVFIDQYLASSKRKWGRSSSLTLLLPHGYEGQGSEHSSARLERFLQLAACDNIGVANVTTPGQFFHLLRRQAYASPAKPLIVMTPKSLLRNPRATSSLTDLTNKSFVPLLYEPIQSPQRVLMCSGKVYYDLLTSPYDQNGDTCFVRFEQLAPFPEKECRALLTSWAQKNIPLFWVQEEPRNMGAWAFIEPHLRGLCKTLGLAEPTYVGRPASDITATGFGACHGKEQETMIAQAFGKEPL